MENSNQTPNEDVIKIDWSCLNNVHIEKDMEASFRYMNIHFISIFVVLVIVFCFQLYYWLPEWEDIDITNFTYKYSNYREWWSDFGVFTAMFLHGSFGHLLSNLLFLYPFTLITSSVLRYKIYLSVIFVTWIFAWEISYILNDLPSIGASWWIFWLFWFLVPYYFYNKSKLSTNVQDIPWAILFMSVYIIWQWITDPYVDNVAHITGFISWIFYGFIYFKFYFEK